MSEAVIISGLASVVITLAGVVVSLAYHVRDLNKTITTRADECAAAAALAAEKRRGDGEKHRAEILALSGAQAELLVSTNRTLDALLASRRRPTGNGEPGGAENGDRD